MSDNPTPHPASAPDESLGRRTARGMGWMLANTGLTRGLSFLAQIALGWLLSKDDFGVYAIATAVAAVAATLRDAGMRQILIQRANQYDVLLVPVFWLGALFNVAAAAVLVVAAWPVAAAYSQPVLVPMMLVIALSVVLGTPASILSTRLQVDLHFCTLSIMSVISSLIRYTGSVSLALLGMGPVSFVLPLVAIALFESMFCWRAVGRSPWFHLPDTRRWPELLQASVWIMSGSLSTQLIVSVPFAVIGLLAPEPVVGLYYWAYQLVAQLGILISANLQVVLFPAFTRIKDDPLRERAGALRAVRLVVFVTAPLSVGIACCYPGLELLIWHGRWAQATLAVQAIGLVYAMHVALSVGTAFQQAKGWFRAWTAVMGLAGVGCVLSGAAGAWLAPTDNDPARFEEATNVIASASALNIVILQFLLNWAALRPIGVTLRALAIATLPPLLFNASLGVAVIAADRFMMQGLPAAVRLSVTAGAFSVAWLVGTRAFFVHTLHDVVQLAPTRLGRPLARLLAISI